MDIVATEKMKQASQFYYCLVTNVDGDKCTISLNGKQYDVKYYGNSPIINKVYVCFLPQNNLSQAFVLGESGKVLSVNGKEGVVNLNATDVGAFDNSSIIPIGNLIYPIGSIYMSTVNTNPSILFGGTWEQLKDRFLLGAGDTYIAGDTGGSATHTLTIDEMPEHNHDIQLTSSALSSGQNFARISSTGTFTSGFISNSGGGQAHNNMPPYLVVYMWKRLTLG